jgi:hypothetical protein
MSRKRTKIGDKFNRLEIKEIYIKEVKNRRETWAKCLCDCGKIVDVRLSAITGNGTKSCGCQRSENATKLCNTARTHGLSKHRLMIIWSSMLQRCYNPKNRAYKYYGQRGIIVCDEWKNSFKSFYDWAIDNDYEDHLTIDRKKNSQGYFAENCRWVDMETQANNTRRNILVTAFGETKTLSEWSKDNRCCVNERIISHRVRRFGWHPEKAITTPSLETNKDRLVTAFGETKTLGEWAKDLRCSVKYDILSDRINKLGWKDMERLITIPARNIRKKNKPCSTTTPT